MAATSRSSPERRSEPLYLNLVGAFASASGDWATAREMQRVLSAAHMQREWPYVQLSTAALQAEILLHDGEAEAALQRWRAFGPGAIHCDWWGLHARVCVGWALAELKAGDATRAWHALSPALAMAASTGEVLGLLLRWPGALEELATAPWPQEAAADQVETLRRCAARSRMLRVSTPTQPPIAPEGSAQLPVELSARELEVLQLAAQGHSNKLIARALGLSPHTVKRHMARMLDKTGLSTRGQLSAWNAGRIPSAGSGP